jgi:hypothetical protein
MATKSIGLTGRDYSTFASWATYVNSQNFSANEIAEVYNDGGAVADTVKVTVGGYVANGFSLTIRPASGQGIKDNANKLTNALRYNASNGAALTNSIGYDNAYEFTGANIIFEDLQIRSTNNTASSTILAQNGAQIRRSIVWKSGNTGNVIVQGAAGYLTVEDSLVVHAGSSLTGGISCQAAGLVISNCTVATVNSGGIGFKSNYTSNPVVKNTVFFNFSTDVQQTAGAGTTNNATSAGSFGGTGWGTSGQTSVTSADFESVTAGSEDYRLKAGGTKLIDTGASGVGSGADVVNTTRTGTRDIGAWDAVASDLTAPTLSSPSGVGGALSCSGSVSTNEGNGTLYVSFTDSATAPTAVQVEAGQDHTGAAALRAVSQAVSATGSQAVGSGSITAGTRYAHFMHKDAAGNRSTVASSSGFTVTSGGGSVRTPYFSHLIQPRG